jgi:hypothetical protein
MGDDKAGMDGQEMDLWPAKNVIALSAVMICQ